jgi:hypothetical protein
MPRISSRVQQGAFGTYNPTNPGRAVRPTLQYKGPSLPQELFSETDLDPPVRRALNQIQNNVKQALGQTKGSPFSYANIISNWPLVNGGANGASPNIVAHGLGQPATGYTVLFTRGGYVTHHALIEPAPSSELIQIWTQVTAFAGVTTVTADLLIYG